MRVIALIVLIACSKPSKTSAPVETSPVAGSGSAQPFPIKRKPSSEHEYWVREIGDLAIAQFQGVGAFRSNRDSHWQVTVDVMELIRDVPLEQQLRDRIAGALRAVPNATEVVEADREVWVVRGDASGAALVEAVAKVVDDLAAKARDEMARDVQQ